MKEKALKCKSSPAVNNAKRYAFKVTNFLTADFTLVSFRFLNLLIRVNHANAISVLSFPKTSSLVREWRGTFDKNCRGERMLETLRD